MLTNYKKGICSSCQEEQYIVHKSKRLCLYCNRKRKPIKPKVKVSKPIKKGNKNSGKNAAFYQLCWDTKSHYCKECGIHLPYFSPIYISHIVPKNVLPAFRYDVRNAFVLCADCHTKFEFGDRKAMAIYPECEAIRNQLMQENYKL